MEHGLFTAGPTIKRLSLLLLFALVRMHKLTMITRDVTKAIVMSKTPLRRAVYLKAHPEMGLQK